MIQKVLVVEDEKELLFALKTKLEMEGFVVVTAMSSSDALKKVSSEQPEAVLLDIMILGKSGLEILKEIRENLKSQIPVIMSTNLNDASYQEQAMKYGVSGYIVKSDTSLQQVVDALRAL
jgi:DNA-binding response OmpR family regulator